MDKFEDDAPALARYQTLTAVFGEPQGKPEADVLVLLARWMADEEVAALVTLVRQATASAATQYRDLAREVAYHLRGFTLPRPMDGRSSGSLPCSPQRFGMPPARNEQATDE